MAERKTRPLTERHQGPELIKKGYQGGEVNVVQVERPVVSDPRGGTTSNSTSDSDGEAKSPDR